MRSRPSYYHERSILSLYRAPQSRLPPCIALCYVGLTDPCHAMCLRYVSLIAANLVCDGATLQMGIGNIPNAVLAALKYHKVQAGSKAASTSTSLCH